MRKQEDGYYGLATDTKSLSPSKMDTQLPLVKPIGEDLKFFYNWKTFGTDNLMFWISMVGTKTEAAKYECTLKILDWLGHTGPALPKKHIYEEKRTCVACDVSHEEIKESASAFSLPKALVERAAEGRGADEWPTFDYRIVIKIKGERLRPVGGRALAPRND